MEKNNEGIVADLYAIRAGMSVISKEGDLFRETVKEIGGKMQQEYDAHRAAKRDLAERRTRLQNMEKEIKDKESEAQKIRLRYYRMDIVRCFLLFLLMFVLFLGAVALVAWLTIGGFGLFESPAQGGSAFEEKVFGMWTEKAAHDYAIFVLLGLIVGGALGVVFLVFSVIFLMKFFKEKKALEEAKQRIADLRTGAEAGKAEWEREKRSVEAASAMLSAEVETPDYQMIMQEEAKRSVHVFAGNVLYSALEQQFARVLDPRDWQNIDYIIYAMETGRARDLREALQLCDRELQVERLEEAIASAAEKISVTIRRGLGDLQAQMEHCFYNLSQQLESSTSRITTALHETNARIAEATQATWETNARIAGMNGYLSKMTATAEMNNALLEKANESSGSLATDVHRLRQLMFTGV